MSNYKKLQILLPVFILCLSAFTLHAWDKELSRLAVRSTWEQTANLRPKVTPQAIDQALEAARVYYMNAQLTEGNFRYGLDLTDNMEDEDDNQVRQAGALWGLSKLNKERFTDATRRCVILGLGFFMHHKRALPDGGPVVITYKAERTIRSGTVALFCLALLDFLDGQEKYLSEAQRKPYLDALYSNLEFLRSQELADGSWRAKYDLENPPTADDTDASPYYDGESLLAYLTAEKYFAARPNLKAPAGLSQRIDYALPMLLKKYVAEPLQPGGDQNLTKGFFQWCLMSCALFCETRTGKLADMAADGAMTLAWWQIYGNKIETRTGNTGYAIEGLVSAWRIANARHMTAEAEVLKETIEIVLGRLMTWQVGGPFEKLNPFLQHWKTRTPARAFGGITAAADSGYIRIDIVQHQVHAMLLAREFIYKD